METGKANLTDHVPFLARNKISISKQNVTNWIQYIHQNDKLKNDFNDTIFLIWDGR